MSDGWVVVVTGSLMLIDDLGCILFSRELWREDGKLSQTVASAKNEKTIADRSLNGMMDKVSLGEPVVLENRKALTD